MSRSTISTFQLFALFPDEESARIYLEQRIWPDGPTCPECLSREHVSVLGTCPSPFSRLSAPVSWPIYSSVLDGSSELH
jgi:Transposase zinc-ribbon domain